MKRHLAIALCLFSSMSAAAADLRVVDETGAPIQGADVVLTIRTSGSELLQLLSFTLSTKTDAEGKANIKVPSAGEVLLFVDHSQYAPEVISRGSGVLPSEIRLDRGQRWSGRVTPPSAATPLESAKGRVCASGELVAASGERSRWERCGEPDRKGRLELTGLPSGTFTVRAQLDGFLPLSRTIDPEVDLELFLEEGALLEGVVTDVRRRPLRGVSVKARDGGETTTSANGRFAVAAAALPATLQIEAPGFRGRTVGVLRQQEIAVELHPATQFSGRLEGEDPSHVEKVTVRIGETVDGQRRGRTSTLTTDEGRFALEVPGSGSYDLLFSAPHYRDLNLASMPITTDQTIDLGTLRLERGAGISGEVLDSLSGTPAEGALIEVLPLGPALLSALFGSRPSSDISGEDGAFLVAGLEPGRYLVRVQHVNRASAHELVNLDQPAIRSLASISLRAGARLHGRVQSPAGHARAGVAIRLYDRAREFMEPLLTTVSTSAGEYEISGVAPGIYRVDIRGGRLLLSQEIEVPRGTDDVEIDFTAGGGRLRGLITRDGEPVRGGAVLAMSILDPGDRRGKLTVNRNDQQFAYGLPESPISATVDQQGRFSFEDAPSGIVRLIYHDAAGARVVRFARIDDRDDNLITLDLSGSLLAGRLVDGSTGLGIEGTVSLIDATGRAVADSKTDPAGSFQFNGLIEGNYALVGASKGYEKRRLEGLRVAPETAPVTVELASGEGGAVRVSLTRGDGTPAADVPVSLFEADGRMVSFRRTPADGSVTFPNLPSGTYHATWYEPLSGAGVSPPLRPKPYEVSSVARTLATGGSLVLSCSLQRCADALIDLLEIVSDEGVEIGPALPGISSALRLSRDGSISLGRLAPGRYTVRLRIGDHNWEERLTANPGGVTVRFE